jgi:hypothetical protein
MWVLRTPDKGVEEHFNSSGQGKRRSCVSSVPEGAVASEPLSSHPLVDSRHLI